MSLVRVLVVDDQALFRRVMGAVVEETDGFVLVGCAASGEESVVSGGVLRPDLVLMDVNLPGIDGMEATRRLRVDATDLAPHLVRSSQAPYLVRTPTSARHEAQLMTADSAGAYGNTSTATVPAPF